MLTVVEVILNISDEQVRQMARLTSFKISEKKGGETQGLILWIILDGFLSMKIIISTFGKGLENCI